VPAGTILEVTGRNSPCDSCPCGPGVHTALITDAAFNIICQEEGAMRVNGGPPCTVAVDQRTWSEVRNLYR
jgi:hypothetical protein